MPILELGNLDQLGNSISSVGIRLSFADPKGEADCLSLIPVWLECPNEKLLKYGQNIVTHQWHHIHIKYCSYANPVTETEFCSGVIVFIVMGKTITPLWNPVIMVTGLAHERNLNIAFVKIGLGINSAGF